MAFSKDTPHVEVLNVATCTHFCNVYSFKRLKIISNFRPPLSPFVGAL